MLASTLIVMVVLVPIAANAVIGTIITMIWQPGDGSRVAPIGRMLIGNVTAMIKFTSVSRNVMVQRVIIIIMMVMVMIILVFIMVRVSATITARLFPKFLLYFFI